MTNSIVEKFIAGTEYTFDGDKVVDMAYFPNKDTIGIATNHYYIGVDGDGFVLSLDDAFGEGLKEVVKPFYIYLNIYKRNSDKEELFPNWVSVNYSQENADVESRYLDHVDYTFVKTVKLEV